MKIMIAGYSGSGKSTLARELSMRYDIPVLHLDTVQFEENWKVRSDEEKTERIKDFLDSHDEWVIDGNYSRFFYQRRAEEADQIILLLFGRLSCLYRAFSRYLKYRGKSRPDMAEGCQEKFDFEFFTWILYGGRKKNSRERYRKLQERYPDKTVVIRNQKELDSYKKKEGIS